MSPKRQSTTPVKASRLTAGKQQAAKVPVAKAAKAATGKATTKATTKAKAEVTGRPVRKRRSGLDIAMRESIPFDHDDLTPIKADTSALKPEKAGSRSVKQTGAGGIKATGVDAPAPDAEFKHLKARNVAVDAGYGGGAATLAQKVVASTPAIELVDAKKATSVQVRRGTRTHAHLGEWDGRSGLWVGIDDKLPGRVVVRAGNAKARIVLDGAECAIRVRGTNENVQAVLGPSADGGSLRLYDANGAAFAYLGEFDGYGGLALGGEGRLPGRIVLRKGQFEDQIVLDADTGDIVLTNADCAEEFDVAGDKPEPGSVLVLDDDPGRLRRSAEPYDTRVAGVVSGAGAYRPGIVLDRRATGAERVPVALVGKVFCQVEADSAPIAPGTLLTTSERPGVAMAAVDRERAFGAVLGKALAPLDAGTALLPVLVTLQ
ncbi:MAG TPA: hypothetical protein VM938_03230 [Acidimicrobiales bacterium]|nr:hypothetical protein [Acidimicrobiales bacterium]